jgi:hypothetical protein
MSTYHPFIVHIVPGGCKLKASTALPTFIYVPFMFFYTGLNVHINQMNHFTKTTSRISIFQLFCFPSFLLGIPALSATNPT